jgi:hypothetical protein
MWRENKQSELSTFPLSFFLSIRRFGHPPTRLFLLVGNFAEFSFSSRTVAAYGLGDDGIGTGTGSGSGNGSGNGCNGNGTRFQELVFDYRQRGD